MAQISGLVNAAPQEHTNQVSFDDLMMINQGFVPGSDSGVEKRLFLGTLRKKFFGENSFIIDSLDSPIQVTTSSNFIPLYSFLSERYTADVPGKYSLKPFSVQFLAKIITNSLSYSYIGSLDFLGYADTTSAMPSELAISNCCQVAIYNASSQNLPFGGFNFRICITDGNQVKFGISWSASQNGENYQLALVALCNGVDCKQENDVVSNNNDNWGFLYGREIGSVNQPIYWSNKGLAACNNPIVVTSQLPATTDTNTIYFVP